jgi:uncharacterized protein (TIGR03437 family)
VSRAPFAQLGAARTLLNSGRLIRIDRFIISTIDTLNGALRCIRHGKRATLTKSCSVEFMNNGKECGSSVGLTKFRLQFHCNRPKVNGRAMRRVFLLALALTTCGGQVITTVAGGGGSFGDNVAATSSQLNQPTGVAVDSAGNIYIADHQDQRVRKVDTSGIITTFAGTGLRGYSGDGGPASSAMLTDPYGVAVDAAGNVYIADRLNYRVRKITQAGIITTVAGNGTAGFAGDGGSATSAMLNNPAGVTVDIAGNLYIADQNNRRIRKVTPAGTITTVAGNGNVNFSGDGGPATAAGVTTPIGIAVDGAGNLYFTDAGRIRKVSSAGTINTIAGNGGAAFTGDGGPATSASLSSPQGVALDTAGNVYIGDTVNGRVRKVTPAGIISTYAGGALIGGNHGDGGLATNASLSLPTGLATDSAGNLFIADSNNGSIRKVSASAGATAISVSPGLLAFTYTIGGAVPASKPLTVSSSAGTLTVTASASGGSWLSVNPASGPTPLTLNVSVNPTALTATTYNGTISITPPPGAGASALTVNVALLVISGTGAINTVAGNGIQGFAGDGGAATSAWLSGPIGVATDAGGNFYIADADYFRIRKVASAGVISTVAGNGTIGFSGDGGPATSAALFPPLNTYQGIAADAAGNLYIADSQNNRVRKVNTAGIISTIAGTGLGIASGDGGPATSAGLSVPLGVAVDALGNLYIAETLSARVRKVNPAGIISTFAGSGGLGFSGDGGPATSATFNAPTAVAVDAAGNVYIADSTAARVRKVNAAGVIATVAGNGTHGSSGDGGPATSASLDPLGMAVDSAGNIFIADANNRIRKVNTAGIISTISGDGRSGFAGDGGPAVNAEFASPADVALSASGDLYIADSGNSRVRKITGVAAPSSGTAPSVALVANAFGETASIAPNTWVEIKGTNLAGSTRIWGDADFASSRMPTQLDGVSVTVNGKSAFIYYVSPAQVNLLTPPDAVSGSVQVQLTNGSSASTMTVAAQTYSPSFFVFDGTHATATHANGSLVGATSLYPGYSTPAVPNETIILYANGLGQTSSPIVSGALTQSGTLPQLPIVKIGGLDATVTFAGLISPGLFQLNVVVPAAVPDGDNALTGTYNGVPMQSGVILSVQR